MPQSRQTLRHAISSAHGAVGGLRLDEMSLLTRFTVFLYVISCCYAFNTRTSTTIRASTPRGTHNRVNSHRKYPLKYSTTSTSYLQHHDAAALSDALNQATQVLLAATDVSRGGAVVEQIPYIPADPSEIPDFPKIVLGSAACVAAYAWAAYEFGKRIVTQRACAICNGTGLVTTTRTGVKLAAPRKCYACGGFLPWENWGRFWQSNMDVGNGGVLQRPASDYDELNKAAREANEQRPEGTSGEEVFPS